MTDAPRVVVRPLCWFCLFGGIAIGLMLRPRLDAMFARVLDPATADTADKIGERIGHAAADVVAAVVGEPAHA